MQGKLLLFETTIEVTSQVDIFRGTEKISRQGSILITNDNVNCKLALPAVSLLLLSFSFSFFLYDRVVQKNDVNVLLKSLEQPLFVQKKSIEGARNSWHFSN